MHNHYWKFTVMVVKVCFSHFSRFKILSRHLLFDPNQIFLWKNQQYQKYCCRILCMNFHWACLRVDSSDFWDQCYGDSNSGPTHIFGLYDHIEFIDNEDVTQVVNKWSDRYHDSIYWSNRNFGEWIFSYVYESNVLAYLPHPIYSSNTIL